MIYGNRLIKANIRTTGDLRKSWSSPAAKNALRKSNRQPELFPADEENNRLPERLVLEMDEDVPRQDGTTVAQPDGVSGQAERESQVQLEVRGGLKRKHEPDKEIFDEITVERSLPPELRAEARAPSSLKRRSLRGRKAFKQG